MGISIPSKDALRKRDEINSHRADLGGGTPAPTGQSVRGLPKAVSSGSEHLVFFGLRPWSELVQYGFHRSSGATFGCLLRSGRFSPVTYVHFEPRWGTTVRIERIGENATAVGLPQGLPLGRFAPIRRASRRLQTGLLARELARVGRHKRLFWLYDWWQIEVAGRLGPGRTLIECLDDPLQVFAGSPSRLADIPAHRAAALARADLVAAVDATLLTSISDGGARFALAPNGIDGEFFDAGSRTWPEPEALAAAPRPRLVVVAGEWSFERRIDHELLGAVMDRLTDWSLVLIGVPQSPGPALGTLLHRPGVVALGAQPQPGLVPLLRACDVGAVPYREAGGRDVLKTYEYLACQLPVVSTVDEPPQNLTPWVTMASEPGAFAAACRELARSGLREKDRLRAVLGESTWERRTERLLTLLDAVRPPAGQ